MKRISLITLALFFMLPAVYGQAALDLKQNPWKIAYLIKVNGTETGYLEIDKLKKNSFSSQYFAIDKADKIPFFCPGKKIGTFDPASPLRLASIGFNAETFDDSKKLRAIYDLKTETDQQLLDYLPSGVLNADKAVLVDSEKMTRIVFDRLPLVCLENIIIGFIYKKGYVGDNLLLYEGYNHLQMKIFFKENSTKQISHKGNMCPGIVLDCYKTTTSGPKRVFGMDIVASTGIPVSIYTKRWALDLHEIGVENTFTEDIKPEIKRQMQEKLWRAFPNARRIDVGVEHRDNSMYAQTKCFVEGSRMPPPIEEKDLLQCFFKNYTGGSVRANRNLSAQDDFIQRGGGGQFWFISAGFKDVEDLLKKDKNVEGVEIDRSERQARVRQIKSESISVSELTSFLNQHSRKPEYQQCRFDLIIKQDWFGLGASSRYYCLHYFPDPGSNAVKEIKLEDAVREYYILQGKGIDGLNVTDNQGKYITKIQVTKPVTAHYKLDDPYLTEQASKIIARKLDPSGYGRIQSRIQPKVVASAHKEIYMLIISRNDVFNTVKAGWENELYKQARKLSIRLDIENSRINVQGLHAPIEYELSGTTSENVNTMLGQMKNRILQENPRLKYLPLKDSLKIDKGSIVYPAIRRVPLCR